MKFYFRVMYTPGPLPIKEYKKIDCLIEGKKGDVDK